jgi:hypothetical protein
MATKHDNSVAHRAPQSPIPTLPPVMKGRKRAAKSMDAAGECSLLLLSREGREIPANVVRLAPLPKPTEPVRSLEMAFLLTIYCNMPPEQRDKIKGSARASAEASRDPDFLGLIQMLDRREG